MQVAEAPRSLTARWSYLRNLSLSPVVEKGCSPKKFALALTKSGRRLGKNQAGLSGEGMMGEMGFQVRVRGRVRAVWLGLALSTIVAQLVHAQSFSGATGQSNLTGLPGQNVAQQ